MLQIHTAGVSLCFLLMFTAAAAAALPVPSPVRLKADVTALVGFGTRHSLSSATDPRRGIGAARAWAAQMFERISKDCGDCIAVERFGGRFTGERAPDGVEVINVIGFQKGRDANRVVIVGAHIDSRVTDVMNFTADAPGANDDASGVALVLEAARLLSKQRFDASIVYAIFSGEEQGMWGGQLLAETARQRGWHVTAMLDNDIVGNSIGQDGVHDAKRVRVFSEGIRASEDLHQQMARRAEGGEDDGPSRALAKAIDDVAAGLSDDFDIVLDRRPDRYGRGGDHEPFLKLGYPAVRFTVGAENWDRQHQDLRTANGVVYGDTIDAMDFDYRAKVTAINVATIARLASAPAAPADVFIEGALSRDTKVEWKPVAGAAAYRVHYRLNEGQKWTAARDVPATSIVLRQVPIDDYLFGVSALSEDGAESLVTAATRQPGGRKAAKR